MERVEWQYTPATSRALRGLSYVSLAAFGGLPLGALASRMQHIQEGQTAEFLVTAAAFLIAPAVIVIMWRVSPDVNGDDRTPGLSLPWTAVGAILVGVVIYGITSLGGPLGVLGLVGVGGVAFGGVALVAVLRSEGAVDPAEGTIKYGVDGRTVSIDDIASVTSIDAAMFSFVWLSYNPGVYATFDSATPRVMVMSKEANATVQRAVDADDGT